MLLTTLYMLSWLAPVQADEPDIPVTADRQDVQQLVNEETRFEKNKETASDDSNGDDIRKRIIDVEQKLLDHRLDNLEHWYNIVTIIITVFGIAIPILLGLEYRRFNKKSKDAVSQIEDTRDKALIAFSEIKGIERKSREMSAEIADLYPDKARKFEKDVQENPGASNIDKAVAIALEYQRQKKFPESLEKWRAIAQITEGIDNTRAAEAWFSVGYLIDEFPEHKTGNRESIRKESISAYGKALQLNPGYTNAYNNRGILKRAQGDFDGAMADYDEAIRLEPDSATVYYNRGCLKRAQGNFDGAMADLNTAIQLKPDHADAYNNRGNLKCAQGDSDGAMADYNEAIRLEPDSATVYYNRGCLKQTQGDSEGAMADYDEAIQLKPDYANAYNNRGDLKRAQGNFDGAMADLNTAIQLKPDDSYAYDSRGDLKRAQGDSEGAMADYNKAIRLEPDDADFYNNRGNLKRARGDFDGAMEDLDTAIQLKQDYAGAYYYRGLLNLKSDQTVAREDFKTALELAKSQGLKDLAKSAEKELQKLGTPSDDGAVT